MVKINRKVTPNMLEKFKNLYENGESILIISKKFRVHFSTVYEHLKKAEVKIRSLQEAGILASLKGRINKHKIPKSSKRMTKEKAYILGVMCGDSYVHCTKNKSYQVSLQTIDKDFAVKFANCLNKVYGLRPSIRKIKVKTPNWNDKWHARVCCKAIYEDILSYGRFKMKLWRVPKIIFNSTPKIKCDFLRGFFDSEGSVDKSKKVIATSINKKGIDEIMDLLSSLGIRSNMEKVSKVKANHSKRYVIKITDRKYIEMYSEKIGFFIKRKQMKLNNLIESYKLRVTPHQDVNLLENKMIYLKNKNMSYQEIANALNLSIGTVWRHLNGQSKKQT